MMIDDLSPIRVETQDGWIVCLQHAGHSDSYELWIGRRVNGKFYSASVEKDGNLLLVEGEPDAFTFPTLKIPGNVWGGFVRALKGIIPKTEEKEIDAELKATKFHLEDMRKLVFQRKDR